MKDLELFKQAGGQEFLLSLKKAFAQVALSEYNLVMEPNRLELKFGADETLKAYIIHGLLTYVTKEEPIAKVPASWWQHVKQDLFPEWLRRKFPVRYDSIIAEHMFPEADIPECVSALGKEFVRLRVIPAETAERYFEELVRRQENGHSSNSPDS